MDFRNCERELLDVLECVFGQTQGSLIILSQKLPETLRSLMEVGKASLPE
jgi:hypothetical protein